MTSTTVTESSKYFRNVTGNVNAAKSQKGAFTDCFSQMWSRQTQNVRSAQNGGVTSCADSVKSGAAQEDRQTQQSSSLSQKTDYAADGAKNESGKAADKVAAEAGMKNDALTPEEEQQISDASQEVLEAVAAQLGLSLQQVQDMMAQLALSPADMLNAEQVSRLMVELAGGGNPLELLTNEQLFGDVEQVLQTLDEVNAQLADELGVSQQELEAMLGRAAAENGASDAQQPQDTENAVTPNDVEDARQTLTQTAAEHLRRPDTQEAVIPKDNREEPVITVENEKPLEAVNRQEQTAQEHTGKENSGSEQKKGQTENGQTYLEQLNGRTVGKTDMTEVVRELAAQVHQAPDTQDIMRQIMDYMKVQVKADMTQMEIQLHPADLGSVNIHISSKEGVITAQFTAQNEAVKTALETQVVQLRENLEQQGVKVEAVEVTVASHAFERNLQQNSEERGEAEPDDRKTPRRINLNLAEEGGIELADMDDADRIAADMMARNGGTVDFSA